MVKTPRTRHSKTPKDPVTIELEPDAVSRIPSETPDAGDADAAPAVAAGEAEASAEIVEAETASRHSDAADEPASRDFLTGDPEPEPSEKPYGYGFEAEETAKKESQAGLPNEDPQADQATRAEQRRGGFPPIAAGIIGAVVALLGAGGLQYAGVLGTPATTTGGAPALDGVQAEIAALQQQVAALREGAGAETGDLVPRIDGLAAALDQVKTDVAALQQNAAPGDGGDNAGLQAFEGRIAGIEAAVARLGQDSGGAEPAEIAALGERIAGLEALVKAAGEATAAGEGRLATLEQSVTALSTKVDAQAAQPKVALAIGASALKAAVDRGDPFLAELETFSAVAPQSPAVADLRAYAEKGVATRAEIVAEMDAAADAMIAVDRSVGADAGFFDRLLSSAESLVKVRPIGAVEGEGVPETVARMEVALNAGDLAAAVAEYETLPENVRAAAGPFIEKLKSRLAVERLVDQAVAGAMKA
ncbi:MAG: phage tail protein [Pseudaminobacter sp.]|nr:phage tail protein [Pseudaminobacter sp.]